MAIQNLNPIFSRTTGIGRLGVVLDLSMVTNTLLAYGFQQMRFFIDWQDGEGESHRFGFQKSRRYSDKPLAWHVYRTPGNFTPIIRVEAWDGNNPRGLEVVTYNATTITLYDISDAANGFSTIFVINKTGENDWAGEPAGAIRVECDTQEEIQAVIDDVSSYPAGDRAILLKSGQDWAPAAASPTTGGLTFTNPDVFFGIYGGTARAILNGFVGDLQPMRGGQVSTGWLVDQTDHAIDDTQFQIDSGAGDPEVGFTFRINNTGTTYTVTGYNAGIMDYTPAATTAFGDNDTIDFRVQAAIAPTAITFAANSSALTNTAKRVSVCDIDVQGLGEINNGVEWDKYNEPGDSLPSDPNADSVEHILIDNCNLNGFLKRGIDAPTGQRGWNTGCVVSDTDLTAHNNPWMLSPLGVYGYLAGGNNIGWGVRMDNNNMTDRPFRGTAGYIHAFECCEFLRPDPSRSAFRFWGDEGLDPADDAQWMTMSGCIIDGRTDGTDSGSFPIDLTHGADELTDEIRRNYDFRIDGNLIIKAPEAQLAIRAGRQQGIFNNIIVSAAHRHGSPVIGHVTFISTIQNEAPSYADDQDGILIWHNLCIALTGNNVNEVNLVADDGLATVRPESKNNVVWKLQGIFNETTALTSPGVPGQGPPDVDSQNNFNFTGALDELIMSANPDKTVSDYYYNRAHQNFPSGNIDGGGVELDLFETLIQEVQRTVGSPPGLGPYDLAAVVQNVVNKILLAIK